MKLKQIIDESFGDYKEAAMLLVTPNCTWKCEGCQNRHLSQLPTKNFPDEEILKRFFKNPLTSAIVIGGLEPLDDMQDVRHFISALGQKVYSEDLPKPTIIVYTGYELDEIEDQLYWSGLEPEMRTYGECILKYGRFNPIYQTKGDGFERVDIWNEDLGINLASPNQGTVRYRSHK